MKKAGRQIMSKNKTKSSLGITSGTASIMMIFVVLCITVFSVLSYVQANAQVNLVQRNQEMLNEYYQADLEALRLRNDIQRALSVNNNAWFSSPSQAWLDQEISEDGARLLKYEVTINDRQTLSVTLEVVGNSTEVRQWQMVSDDSGTYEIEGFID